ncbi:HyaD/HybD family hydrogenase maturation endopeptidase [Bradyrhizobium sp. AUGA SZCCT0283]|uniref:HyaD/HybD family hydrogenase maturation endopeptidase n=1 Tax=Bradyrhizobium sp. AUGA SZCCT0283 TaxID=2807671 RepID=UPI0039080373
MRAVEAMHRLYQWPENVRLMDGGTQGLYLVQHVREADILIVFDAVDYGLPPGTIKLVEGDEVPKFLGAKKISLHQTGFQEVLATAELLGGATQHLYLIGVQPVELDDFGGSLRDEMKARIGPAIQHAIDFLARFGISGYRRDVPLPETETLACEHMVMSRYEAQRPSAEDACRFGDPRVLMAERVHAGTADRQPPQTPGVG